MTVAELGARISSAELTEWQAYLRVENEELEQRRTLSQLEAQAAAGVQRRTKRVRNR